MSFEGPSAEDLGFELLPPSTQFLSPEDDVESAIASALAPDYIELPDEPRVPLGRSWAFDWERGRFFRRGSSPAEARGVDALREWCLMAQHSARYAHAIFDDAFGVEDLEEEIGILAPVDTSFAERLSRALLVHERISAVDNIVTVIDSAAGTVTFESLEIVQDEDDRLRISGAAETAEE